MLRHRLAGVLLYLWVGGLLAHATAPQYANFLEAPQYATGTNPQAVAMGDFNGDGKTDLAVVNSTSNTVSILLGNGDGTFQTQVTYATGTTPQGIAVGVFTSSGFQDLAITNSASNTVSILIGNGDGTFQPQVTYATGTKPEGIAVGYFTGSSGPLSLAVTNAGAGNVGILIGNGNGTFKTMVTYNTGVNPSSVAVGDVNNDGIPDLVIANNNDDDVVSVLLGQGTGGVGNGTFQNQYQYATGSTPVWVALADFNGDGDLDIAVADQQGNTVSILMGKGNGGFATHVEYPTAAFPTAVAIADFNGDGKLDLAVSAGNGNTVSILWGNGDGTFQGQENTGTGDIPYSVITGDFNNDGNVDLVVANSGGNSVSVIMNDGSGTFQSRIDYPAGGTEPYSVAVGDFNGDGFLDLAVAISNCENLPNCGPGTISIIMGNGDGTFQAPTQYSTGTNTDPNSIAVGDFNGDGILDLAVTNYETNSVSILLGQGSNGVGNGTFETASPAYTFAVGSEPSSVAVGDFNGDGILDLAVTNFHSNNVSVLLGNGDGTFQTAVNYPTGNGPVSLAVGNFGNGNQDLVVVNETDNDVGVLLGNSNGTFQAQATYSTGAGGNPLSVVVGDFSGNGILDLAVADFHSQQVSILMGNGNGTFQAVKQYPTGANPSSVVTADFNGDGIPDLALASQPLPPAPGNVVSVLLGNGDGTFGAPAVFGTGSFSYSGAVGDFNGDGAADLAVANGVSNTVSVVLNAEGTQITATPSANPSSYGQSVTFTTTVAASVPGAGSPTGTVTLTSGSTTLGSGTLSNGSVIVTTSSLPTGSDTVSVAYSGSSNFQPHTVSVSQTVNKAGSTTSLGSSVNPSSDGQSVTFTATVASATSGTPTGTVTFLDGTTSIGGSTLNSSGVATLTTSALALGTHSITAAYGGNTNFNSSTSSVLSQSVVQGSTTATLISSPNPSSYNQSVTLTATVSSTSPGTPTGTVTFSNGTTSLGTSSLSASGVATLAVTVLPVGTDSITAAYSGDSNFSAATSSPMSQTVQQASTSTTLTASSGAAVLTLTATVSSPAGMPSGTVTFMDGTTQLGSTSVNGSGVATLSSLTTLTAGTNNITASYSGGSGSNFAASTSSAAPVAVGFTLTDAALSPSSVQPGGSATSIVTVAPTNGFNSSLVTLTCAITPAATPAPTCTVGSVTNGTATVTIATTPNSRALAASFIDHRPGMLLAFGLLIPAMLLGTGALSKQHKQRMLAYCFGVLVLGGCLFQAACGGGGSTTTTPPPPSGGTPAGAYTVTITGSSGSVTNVPAPTLSLTVQ
jgi:hypothetical protein